MIGLKAFIGAIIGGFTSYPVAALGAVLVGIMESFASFWSSSFKEVIVFGLLIPVLLRHPVTNLVDNGVRYNRPGGTVWVRLTGRTLTITYTGTPVDPDRADGLFEPFRPLGQDRTSTSGHGLGLSIVRAVVAAHRGTLSVVNNLNGGATFCARWPIQQPS